MWTAKSLDTRHKEGGSKSTACSWYGSENPIDSTDAAGGNLKQEPLLLMFLVSSAVMAEPEIQSNELRYSRHQLKVALLNRLKSHSFWEGFSSTVMAVMRHCAGKQVVRWVLSLTGRR